MHSSLDCARDDPERAEGSDILAEIAWQSETLGAPAQTIFRVERPAILRPASRLVKAKTTTSCDFLVGQSQYLALFSHPPLRRRNESGVSPADTVPAQRTEAPRSGSRGEDRRWEGVAFRRLPRVHRQDLSCGMCPTTFAVERGTFDLPPDRAGDVPRHRERDRPKRWGFRAVSDPAVAGLGM